MTKNTYLKYYKTSENAFAPSKPFTGSAGFDLHSAHDVSIPAMGVGVVSTDLAIQLPEGTYGRIAPRSGLAAQKFIGIGGGVIDPDYTGALKVIIFNHGGRIFKIWKGDRVAQLIIEKYENPKLQECKESFNNIAISRMEKGLGSSGGYQL